MPGISMEKTGLAVLAPAMALGSDVAFGEPATGTGDPAPYAADDILYTFDNMGLFVTLNDDYHLVVNETAGYSQQGISELNIAIARDFAAHSDAIIDAAKIGPVGRVNELASINPELINAIHDFENGKFRSLFNGGDRVIRTSLPEAGAPVTHPAHASAHASGAFGIGGAIPAHHSAPGTACGGGFLDPHVRPPIREMGSFPDMSSTVSELVRLGYHKVPAYATGYQFHGGNYEDDYAKVGSAYGCNRGEFRDQALIAVENGRYHYRTQGPEVNPEIFSYIWPATWWGTYVFLWHMQY